MLSSQDGLLGVVDFYTAGKQPSLHEKAIGGASKECGWLTRWFWQIWFDFDHVSIVPIQMIKAILTIPWALGFSRACAPGLSRV